MAERSGLKQIYGMPLKHFNCWQANLIPYKSGRGHGKTDNQQRKKKAFVLEHSMYNILPTSILPKK